MNFIYSMYTGVNPQYKAHTAGHSNTRQEEDTDNGTSEGIANPVNTGDSQQEEVQEDPEEASGINQVLDDSGIGGDTVPTFNRKRPVDALFDSLHQGFLPSGTRRRQDS